MLPVGKNHELELVAIKDLGVSFPVLINPSQIEDEKIPDPEAQEDDPDAVDALGKRKTIPVPRFDFTVQFCWQETPPSTRAKKKAERTAAAAAAAAAAASAEQAAGGATMPAAQHRLPSPDRGEMIIKM